MKKIDSYIIRKFFKTFFFTITLILMIVIVFDISEKIDDFLENELSIQTIILDYYIYFIPYFGNLFSPLFIFISVVFFTSRMANNTEIIAILNTGMSFYRLLFPFILSAAILCLGSFFLSSFIIPEANKERIDFERKYLRNNNIPRDKNIHMQIKEGQYIYVESFNTTKNIGYKFTLENFHNNQLISKLKCDYIKYDTLTNKWRIHKYKIRIFNKDNETIIKGASKDTSINLLPTDFTKRLDLVETMNHHELNKHIAKEEIKGTEQIVYHKIEKHKRIAFPFASIILTIIAVSIASQKIKGGVGTHIGIGIIIAFSYILFMQISTTFAIKSNLPAAIAVWIPNILYTIIAMLLTKIRPY
tara:strand:+ start:126 stop:1202 length:1077 start_codon:yes stop_codon:yes gene_type:complete